MMYPINRGAFPVFSMVLLFSFEVMAKQDQGIVLGRIAVSPEKLFSEQVVVQRDDEVCGLTRTVEWVGGEHGGLRNAVVYIADADLDAPLPDDEGPVEVSQKTCRFSPTVRVARAGSVLRPTNSDPIMHNIHVAEIIGRGRRNIHNVGQEPGDPSLDLPIDLRRGRAIKLSCGIHDFMHAWVFYPPNAYYDVTDDAGHFRLDGLEPGRYELRVWHGWLGEQRIDIDVPERGELRVDLGFE